MERLLQNNLLEEESFSKASKRLKIVKSVTLESTAAGDCFKRIFYKMDLW